MRRVTPFIPFLAVVFLAVPAAAQSGSTPADGQARKEKAKPKEKEKEKAPPKVYTNDDLEATSTRPSNVQNATAQGAEPYNPPPEPDAPPAEEPPPPAPEGPQMTEEERQIKEAEETVKSLEQTANALLWQYLQSGDTNEILRLKEEQRGVLEQLEQAKADLARLKGQATTPPPPTPAPTPPPG